MDTIVARKSLNWIFTLTLTLTLSPTPTATNPVPNHSALGVATALCYVTFPLWYVVARGKSQHKLELKQPIYQRGHLIACRRQSNLANAEFQIRFSPIAVSF